MFKDKGEGVTNSEATPRITTSWYDRHYKTKKCKCCGEEKDMKNNSYYCRECNQKLSEYGAMHWKIGDWNLWLRANAPVLAISKDGKPIKAIYIGKELIPND